MFASLLFVMYYRFSNSSHMMLVGTHFKGGWVGHRVVLDSFIHSVFRLTTGPKHLPKRFLHIV
jgi:hypothetical protein